MKHAVSIARHYYGLSLYSPVNDFELKATAVHDWVAKVTEAYHTAGLKVNIVACRLNGGSPAFSIPTSSDQHFSSDARRRTSLATTRSILAAAGADRAGGTAVLNGLRAVVVEVEVLSIDGAEGVRHRRPAASNCRILRGSRSTCRGPWLRPSCRYGSADAESSEQVLVDSRLLLAVV